MLRDEELMVEDLLKSGLTPEDLNARPLETPERTNTNTPITTNGYVIPYFHLDGRPTTFYRTRLFDHKPKYKQPQGTSSYVYFPKGFLKTATSKPYVIITEGEKKATLATKLGFPCIGLGGIDAWRNRTIAVPDETGIDKRRGKLVAKIPQGTDVEELSSGYALGFQDFIDFVIARGKTVIIIFDTDHKEVKPPVQRAAATLAFELRYKGLPFNKIRQVVLPPSKDPRTPKVGLDDFFQSDVTTAPQILQQLIQKAITDRGAFPKYPAIREFVNKRLQKSKLGRKELQAVSIAILATMDAEGMRLRSEQQNETFYFDKQTHALLKAEFTRVHDLHDTSFGQYLYKRFGLSKADRNTNEWLAAQFTGEDPIGRVSPHRVIARTNTREDSVTYQISDSQFVKVNATSLTLHNNGDAGVLFESEQVEPLDADKLLQEFERQKSNATNGHIKPLWMNVLSDVRLKDHGHQQQITALLYYMSPWLYRWRNLQLPVEQIIGESGSGKSTLMELRLAIINGQPRLRNAPTDLKDWHASIANSGGLHVTDNVQLVDRTLRQRLSDEICRIITEPDPHIEMRKLYTNADLMRVPVRSVFAITAIKQPFQNADLIQRSIITELDKFASVSQGELDAPIVVRYDSEWRNTHLATYNGREGWVAHHLLVLQRFFQLVKDEWNDKYQAKHRLINFEQTMCFMAKAVGIPNDWIPEYLARTVDKALADSDWTFEGLKYFTDTMSQHYKPDTITAQTISDWATTHGEYGKCEMLINQRRLQRYMQEHKTMIATVIGLVETTNNLGKQVFKIIPTNQRPSVLSEVPK